MGRPSNKEQLIERTLGVWLTQGFQGASVNDLVAAAGVPKGSFYNHFSSKEHFAVEHVHRYMRSLNLDSLGRADGPAVDALRQHFSQHISSRDAARMPPACLLGTFSTGVTESQPELLCVASVLARARDACEIDRGHDPGDLAAALVDGFQGAVARARVTSDSRPLDLFLSQTIPTLIGRDGTR